jgi:hypothetical protein
MIYDFGVRGLEVGDYNVVLTVDGAEVEYSLDVTIDSGVPVSSTTGRIGTYSISSLCQTMNLNINLATMYDDIDAGTYTDPVVRLFLVKGGEL